MARPTVMTQPVIDELSERLSAGQSLRAICADEHMPALSTVMLAVVDDRDGFRNIYMRAREAAGHSHADRIIDIADKVANGDMEPQAAKVIIDGMKWAAERMAPKVHSQKQEIDHRSTDGSMTPPRRIEIVAGVDRKD